MVVGQAAEGNKMYVSSSVFYDRMYAVTGVICDAVACCVSCLDLVHIS
jgi:hypothetical protein